MVRSVTFEIRWHDTQPIYSCSFQPMNAGQLRRVLDYNTGQAAGLTPDRTLDSSGSPAGPSTRTSQRIAAPIDVAGGQNWRLATAGGDNNVRIWLVKPSIPSPAAMANAAAAGLPSTSPHPPRVEYLATLTRHSGVVNCVRFSPSGDMLASAGDDGTVMLWGLTDRPVAATFGEQPDDGEASFEKEHWRLIRMIRVSPQEIYDMAWSPNGESLIVGGTDFVARIVNAHDGSVTRELSDHTHYVQGVAWDPLNDYLATQSSDRSVHVHALHHHHSKASGSSSSTSGYVPPVTRNSRMDVHRRNGSGQYGWETGIKPPMRRGSSHHSHMDSSDAEADGGSSAVVSGHAAGEASGSSSKRREGSFTAVRGRTARSHTPMEPPVISTPHLTHNIARAATPTPAPSVPQSPAFSTASVSASTSAHPMNPPQKTPSRRSSFSGSQVDVATSPPTSIASLAHHAGVGHSGSAASIYKAAVAAAGHDSSSTSATATPGPGSHAMVPAPSSSSRRSASRPRSIRSPSPAPLPAIRPPPSPRQRIQAAQQLASSSNGLGGTGGGGSLLQTGMRLYGDETFSGFFRRLSFSPDGALLVTPSGIFEAPSPASPLAPSPGKSPVGSSSQSQTASQQQQQQQQGPRSTVYLYGRANLMRSNAPLAHLPGHKTATLVVRFSPILYELRRSNISAFARAEDGGGIAPHPNIPLEAGKQKSVNLNLDAAEDAAAGAAESASSSRNTSGSSSTTRPTRTAAQAANSSSQPPSTPSSQPLGPPPPSMIGLPYRMVFAVATHDVVWIYDTQQGGPLCCFSNMHYAAFTDLSWSPDGQTLVMASSDGYCSVAVFEYGELGRVYSYGGQPSLTAAGASAGSSSAASGSSGSTVTTLQTKKRPAPPQSLTATPVASGSGSAGVGADAAPATPSSSASIISSSPALGITGLSATKEATVAPVPASNASSDVESKPSVEEKIAPAASGASGESAPDASKKKRRIQPTLLPPS
ncbi:WD40 repeat-like protein [Jaminaea rosea]|uniref:WD40 repeat-like protein n=1 Tax=Jaminaea rosea TaxID=1569628 RepID=A0A316V3U8_9BASI|nr:WD40 repeat-like protein [Jaminaea rosea]PWN30873.1 WD40 repeat-like protein [Jaminaea rosea]